MGKAMNRNVSGLGVLLAVLGVLGLLVFGIGFFATQWKTTRDAVITGILALVSLVIFLAGTGLIIRSLRAIPAASDLPLKGDEGRNESSQY